MLTGRHVLRVGERRRYVVDLSGWLGDEEVISDLSVEVDPPLVVDDLIVEQPDRLVYQFFVSGGVAGAIYDVSILCATDQGQVRHDLFQFAIRG